MGDATGRPESRSSAPAERDAVTYQDYPLTPFVDALPVPARRVVTASQRLVIPLRTGFHRFHRDLPPSPVWTYEGTVPGPTVEVRRGLPLEVRWENRLTGTLPVIVTVAPTAVIDGVPVQATPGRSGGLPDPRPRPSRASRSSICTGHSHTRPATVGPRTSRRRASPRSTPTRMTSARRCSGTTTT